MSTMTSENIPQRDEADRLGKALKHRGIKVGEMADYLGVSRNTVGNYINGRTSPDKRTLRLWALRTGVPMEWLEHGSTSTNDDPDGGSLTISYPKSGALLAFPSRDLVAAA